MAGAHKLQRWMFIWLSALVLLCAAARIYAPTYIEQKVNQAISESEGIEGKVDDIDLALWRGAYKIHGIELYSVAQDKKQPLLFTDTLDLSILWSALFRGQVVAELHFIKPHIHLLDRPGQAVIENDQARDADTWIDLANQLVPFAIDRVDISDGQFDFELIADQQQSLFTLSDTQGVIKNITNIRDKSRPDFATANLSGLVQNQAEIQFNGSYNPFEAKPTFDADISMQRLDVAYLDRFIKYYLPIDFEAGQLDLAMELISQQGEVDGYVKAGIYNLDVFSWKEDLVEDGDNPFALLLEAISGGLTTLLESNQSDMVATRIPISGNINNPELSTFDAITGLFRNALVEAYDMDIDQLFSFSDENGPQREG